MSHLLEDGIREVNIVDDAPIRIPIIRVENLPPPTDIEHRGLETLAFHHIDGGLALGFAENIGHVENDFGITAVPGKIQVVPLQTTVSTPVEEGQS